MKLWYGYGSEHSANIEMIGQFKSVEDARDVYRLFERLAENADNIVDADSSSDRFSDEALDLLRELNVHSLHPLELEQFMYGDNPELENDRIVLRTDEIDVSAFFKLMVLNGAKVQILSRHDYPLVEGGEAE